MERKKGALSLCFSMSSASVVCQRKLSYLRSLSAKCRKGKSEQNMGKDNACRICEKKYSSNFANLFDSKVQVYECENYMISYFEAMQQLTGMEVCIRLLMRHLNVNNRSILLRFCA